MRDRMQSRMQSHEQMQRHSWTRAIATVIAGAAIATLGASACSEERAGSTETTKSTDPAGQEAASQSPPVAEPAAPEPVAEPAAPEPAVPEPAPAAARPGHDFIAEARTLYRVVACAGDAPIPAHLDAGVIEAHCKRLTQRKERYRERYATMAKEFIAKLRPEGLPDRVVYPFGGGDLISALVAYPDAKEITTMSLEHAGDPRRIRDMDRDELEASLEAFSEEIGGMLVVSNNTSKNLSAAHTNLLPAQLSSFLVGLAVHDFEPVSVRYITVEDDGSLRYLDNADIKAVEDEQARQLKHDWQAPNFSPAFSNVEIQFRRRDAGDDAPVRIHRHFAANLADSHLKKNPAILEHLRAKGRVAAMTKAASYLLWRGDFSLIRDYLLEHMELMISDSTGIPPRYAKRAGMVQKPLGRFTSSFLEASDEHNSDFLELWNSSPRRRLPFRFGYVDAEKQAHLLITRPAKDE